MTVQNHSNCSVLGYKHGPIDVVDFKVQLSDRAEIYCAAVQKVNKEFLWSVTKLASVILGSDLCQWKVKGQAVCYAATQLHY